MNHVCTLKRVSRKPPKVESFEKEIFFRSHIFEVDGFVTNEVVVTMICYRYAPQLRIGLFVINTCHFDNVSFTMNLRFVVKCIREGIEGIEWNINQA